MRWAEGIEKVACERLGTIKTSEGLSEIVGLNKRRRNGKFKYKPIKTNHEQSSVRAPEWWVAWCNKVKKHELPRNGETEDRIEKEGQGNKLGLSRNL